MKLLDRKNAEHRLHGLFCLNLCGWHEEPSHAQGLLLSTCALCSFLSLLPLPPLLTGSLWFLFLFCNHSMSNKHEARRCEEWQYKDCLCLCAPVGVHYKQATPSLLLIHTKKQGALCTLFNFPILLMEQSVSHFEVWKKNLFMTHFCK